MTVSLALVACGSGGGDAPTPRTPASNDWVSGSFLPASTFKNQCVNPRSGTSDMRGSVTAENNWLRSWTNDLYLWYSEVPDRDPARYSTADYFELLKTPQTTATGKPKDRFHFSMSTAEYDAFSQSGVTAGYGAQFFILQSTPPREVIVAFTEPNTPAANAGLVRGDEIIAIDGADVVTGTSEADVAKLNAGLSPETAGESHTFTVRNNGNTRAVTMVSGNVTSSPVQNVRSIATQSGNVGYLLFNDHIATAEQQLISAITTLKGQAITDLVLDIRYNGGGYLDIASELAYMIAGSSRTTGQTFERIAFNDKHTSTNPVTGAALAPTPFHTRTQGFAGTAAGVALPTLNLSTVYVLTSSDTCSASEAIINSLRGVGVEVIQIGTTTCGKPYGFYAQDNCGTTYFSVQFKGVNAEDFGDYADGFSPQNTVADKGEPVEGCSVADDFTHALGDAGERMLSTALNYRLSSTCPAPAAGVTSSFFSKPGDARELTQGSLLKPEWQKNRILRPE
jgi:C-terminal processing protease CtpA/Prc